jgi:hypothetical protein
MKERDPLDEPLFRPYVPEGAKGVGWYLLWVAIAIAATLVMFTIFKATVEAW